MALAGLLVAVLALLVSIIVAWVQHRQSSRLTAIEEARREEEIVQRKAASLLVEFEEYLTSSGRRGHRLVLTNRGQAIAQDVAFNMDSDDGSDDSLPHMMEEPWPLTLQVGQRYEITAAVSMSTALNVRGTLSWRDERGPQQQPVMLSI
jgi:hypothetical protein